MKKHNNNTQLSYSIKRDVKQMAAGMEVVRQRDYWHDSVSVKLPLSLTKKKKSDSNVYKSHNDSLSTEDLRAFLNFLHDRVMQISSSGQVHNGLQVWIHANYAHQTHQLCMHQKSDVVICALYGISTYITHPRSCSC